MPPPYLTRSKNKNWTLDSAVRGMDDDAFQEMLTNLQLRIPESTPRTTSESLVMEKFKNNPDLLKLVPALEPFRVEAQSNLPLSPEQLCAAETVTTPFQEYEQHPPLQSGSAQAGFEGLTHALTLLVGQMSVQNQQFVDLRSRITMLPHQGSPPALNTSSSTNASAIGSRVCKEFRVEASRRNLRFSGRTGEDVLIFLKRMDALRVKYALDDESFFNMFTECLDDPALRWFEQRKDKMQDWEQLRTAFKTNYLDPYADLSLMTSIINRKQGMKENSEVFISAMIAMNSDLVSPFEESKLIQIIVKNLHPKLVVHVGAKAPPTLSALEETCRMIESLQASKDEYQSPSPEVLCHPAYGDPNVSRKHRFKDNKVSRPQVAAIEEPEKAQLLPIHTGNIRTQQDAQHVCKGCKRMGHREAECKTTKRPFCWNCGIPGKTTSDCHCFKPPSSPNDSRNRSGTVEVSEATLRDLISAINRLTDQMTAPSETKN